MHGRTGEPCLTGREKLRVKSEKSRCFARSKIISRNVGQGLAPAEIINEYMITNGCYQIKFDIIP